MSDALIFVWTQFAQIYAAYWTYVFPSSGGMDPATKHGPQSRATRGRITIGMNSFSKFSNRLRGQSRALLIGSAMLVTTLFAAPAALALEPAGGFADVAAIALPAYVDIATTQTAAGPGRPNAPEGGPFDEFFRDFFEGLPDQGQGRRIGSQGSGFVIDPSGIIVTNNHVVAGADQVVVVFTDGTRLPATILGRDERADLAVLKVDAGEDLPFIKWGDSDGARIGDWIVAIGNPFGLGGTITAGIISARARNINAGPYDQFIQTDASINQGNSGGPLINLAGEVIGINTAIYSPTGASVGLGFAIPSNLARPIVDQLVEFGRARRGWLGVRIQRVTDEIAEGLELDTPRGALIAGLTVDGPAGRGGIEVGDVVLSFAGEEVPDMRSLPLIVAQTTPDELVEVEVWRDGGLVTLEMRVGELTDVAVAALQEEPEPLPPVGGVKALGLTLTQITPDLRQQFGIGGEISGVVITDVIDGTDAAARRIQPGDVILEVAQQEVSSPDQVTSLVEARRASNLSSVLMLIQEPNGDLRFVSLSLNQG